MTRGSARGAARLLSLELRHNAMPWLLPLVAVLFWVTTYRKAMAQPPLWSLRATTLQTGSLLTFVGPVTGAAAWMASRDGRRRTRSWSRSPPGPGGPGCSPPGPRPPAGRWRATWPAWPSCTG